jgi:hypothetical protein
MKTENQTKDAWDKLEIFGKILIPIAIGLIAYFGNKQLTNINNRLTTETRDVDIVQRFGNIYYYEGNQDSRRLSIYYIRLINDHQTRYELRRFIVWDTLERNITYGFEFDQELGDWHLIGDVISDMAVDNYQEARAFWCNVQSTSIKRWHLQEIELNKLFDWVDNIYENGDSIWSNCS